jgi:predicted ribonuclease toxin of YeeF-YezG toxin-antitoxin module
MTMQETHANYRFAKEIEEIKKAIRSDSSVSSKQNKAIFDAIEILCDKVETANEKYEDLKSKLDELGKIVIEIYRIVSKPGGNDGRANQTN